MARPKKGEEKDAGTALSQLQVPKEDFVRTRDAVVTALATLQTAVQDLSRAYITHTNTVLGKSPGHSLEMIPNSVGSVIVRAPSAGTEIIATEPDGKPKKKEKRKREHDPNAPKRPLTPYFLFMQTARAIIAQDLGPEATPNDVSKEGTRRWNEMKEKDADEVGMWKMAYENNMADYRVALEEYKQKKAAENGGVVPAGIDDGDTAVTDAAAAAPEKPKAKRQRKTKEPTDKNKEAPSSVSKSAIVPPSASKPTGSGSKSAIPVPGATNGEKEASPEKEKKKRGRKSGRKSGVEEAETPAEPEKEKASKEKRESTRKKRKSAAE
jgi:hypothetical protein